MWRPRSAQKFPCPQGLTSPPKPHCMLAGKFWLTRFFQQEMLPAQILPRSVWCLGVLQAMSTGHETDNTRASLEILSKRQLTRPSKCLNYGQCQHTLGPWDPLTVALHIYQDIINHSSIWAAHPFRAGYSQHSTGPWPRVGSWVSWCCLFSLWNKNEALGLYLFTGGCLGFHLLKNATSLRVGCCCCC